MAAYKVELCGADTAHLTVLKHEEMMRLFEKMQAGDPAAREALIEGNLRLVLSIVQRFSARGENPDDLFQIGCVGLMKSVDHFDTTLNVRFSTYAVPMIIGEIRRYLRDNNAIRVSRSMRDTAYKALGLRETALKETGKEPSIDEIAKQMELSVEDVALALNAITEPVSLYEPVFRDNGDAIYLVDQIHDESQGEHLWINDLAVRQAMEKLAQREKRIVEMRFFQGRTQMEVAREIGISQAQVSRLEKGALKKMRRSM